MKKETKKKIAGYTIIIALAIVIMTSPTTLRFDRFGLAKISWIDCLQINDDRYVNNNYPHEEVNPNLIDEQIGQIRFNISEKVGNPNYRFRDEDATYLEVGTMIYSIEDEPNRVAALVDGVYKVYTRGE